MLNSSSILRPQSFKTIPDGLFFPSHDIALSKGMKHFTPPKAAAKLGEDLSSLAQWWNIGQSQLQPWGWNYDSRALLLQCGNSPEVLPSDQDLITLRELSSRRTSIDILQQFASTTELSQTVSATLPQWFEDTKVLKNYLEHQYSAQQSCVLKTPWSSSGRGLCVSTSCSKDEMLKRGNACIKKMGGIVAEHWENNLQDFAMLFYVGKETIHFLGYSMFETDDTHTYRAGYLNSNRQIVNHLNQKSASAGLDLTRTLNEIQEIYTHSILPNLLAPFMHRPWEVGYLGIDMMLYQHPTKSICIHPCIEMNLRCTMGIVARQIFDHCMHPEAHGKYYITPASSTNDLQTLDNQLSKQFPQTFDTHNRCIKGYFPLTEIHADTNFLAYILVES